MGTENRLLTVWRAIVGAAAISVAGMAFADDTNMRAGEPIVLAQAGSTGGIIGKTDKSISGGEDSQTLRRRVEPPKSHLRSIPIATIERGISIINGSYGADGGSRVEVTSRLNKACKGKRSCEFLVSNGFFGHDPQFGAIKNVIVNWTCGSARTSTFSEYTTARLNC